MVEVQVGQDVRSRGAILSLDINSVGDGLALGQAGGLVSALHLLSAS